LLHFAAAISLSAWILNLRIQMTPDRKPLFAIGIAVAVGSIWSSLQQWFGYLQTGLTNDITLVAGAMLMDAAGGCVTYILFHLNILRKWFSDDHVGRLIVLARAGTGTCSRITVPSFGSCVILWNALMISLVTGPGFPSPIGTPCIRMTGTISARVPVRKTSSAFSSS